MPKTPETLTPRQPSATTVTAVNALLMVLPAAWWLAHGGDWLQVAALSLPLAVVAVAMASWGVRALSPSLGDARLDTFLRISLLALAGAFSVACSTAVLDLLG